MTDPRAVIGQALRSRSHAATLAFARVVGAEEETSAPCWGELADQFDAILATDEARVDVFEALRAACDLGALILFLDLNRTRSGVLSHVWAVASELPATVQCALVSLDEQTNVPTGIAAQLHPAAQRLLTDADARARDHELYAAHAGALRALRLRAGQVSASGVRTP